MSDRYEILYSNHASRGRHWEGCWRVFDMDTVRYVSIGFESLDKAERCRNALILDDRRNAERGTLPVRSPTGGQ